MSRDIGNLKRHARRRFRQRFHLTLNKNKKAQIIKGIKTGKYPLVRYTYESRAVFRVEDIGKYPFNVVYDPILKEIVTVLYTRKRY